ncbi:DNA recombination protein RmuC [Chlamydia trachomatis]|uniref:DNA recombination protein n=1 Tax=Chlamydia trachomatis serovar L2b (strain UCH-1/proctitis) TaxID=471473 RepID=A0A6H2W2S8_CHLTB|nr:DNA recombination protein RmuC [Chlamydia trachomatis]AKC30192.1 recombinase RmuC [Chlamydia trachomatis]AKC31102.1 recombinase RmuC [Chlamydia trachomatis]UYF98162.1 DNA recombination protein RmuC [Chlamydia trachomatis]CAP06595.1 DNA recombination protein [Chlamydia trachomatis L2b/UCH-1/proctitis]CCP52128.1 DNA recombination protein RmuC [Chlamydia trachomatis L2b/8200/07]
MGVFAISLLSQTVCLYFTFFSLGIALGVLFSFKIFTKKLSRQYEIIRDLEHSKAILQMSLDTRRSQEQIMEEFSHKLTSVSQAFARDMKTESQEFFSEKTQAITSVLAPVHNTLSAFKQNLENFETKQAEDRGALKEQLSQLLTAEQKLERETQALTNILKHPGSRGRWGEIQLERILEISGMLKYCDYSTQTVDSSESSSRADIVIRLPQNRSLVIDAKTPFSEEYLTDNHADPTDLVKKIKDHIKTLKTKSYWDKFEQSPEFVILFLPGESLFNDAIRCAPELMDYAGQSNVILSSPVTLMALLKTVTHVWKQENLQNQIREIGQLGKDLYQRMHKLFDHFHKVGKHLGQAVHSYNDMSSSLSARVLPILRTFDKLELSSSHNKIEALSQVSTLPHSPKVPCPENDLAECLSPEASYLKPPSSNQ